MVRWGNEGEVGRSRIFWAWLFVVVACLSVGTMIVGQYMLAGVTREWARAAGYELAYNGMYISSWREVTWHDVQLQGRATHVTGTAGTVRVSLDVLAWLRQRDVLMTVQATDMAVTSGDTRYEAVALNGTIQRAGDGWALHDVQLEQAASSWQARGTVGDDGTLAVDVSLETADLQEAVPQLAPYHIAGPGAFVGVLQGTLAQWELAADATVGPGQMWGRHHVSGAGALRLTADELSFHDVTLWQFGGVYALAGSVTFPKDGHSGALDLYVESSRGRLQELVALFSTGLPVEGRLDGNLHFRGPFGDVQIAGDVTINEGVLWDQPVDQLQGEFHWQKQTVQVTQGQAVLGSGVGTFEGIIDLAGDSGDINFSFSDWPLAFTNVFDAHFGDVLGGFVDVSQGHLTGSVSEPHVEAIVTADSLRVGPTHFKSVTGSLAADGDQLQFLNVFGVRVGGGEYGLNGAVHILPQGDSRVELQITVDNDRLARLLQLARADWPQLPTDGLVSGQISVSGLLVRPIADFDLRLRERLLGNKELRLGMRLADGAWRVQDMVIEGT